MNRLVSRRLLYRRASIDFRETGCKDGITVMPAHLPRPL
jgi:hypothetical protein